MVTRVNSISFVVAHWKKAFTERRRLECLLSQELQVYHTEMVTLVIKSSSLNLPSLHAYWFSVLFFACLWILKEYFRICRLFTVIWRREMFLLVKEKCVKSQILEWREMYNKMTFTPNGVGSEFNDKFYLFFHFSFFFVI